MLQFQYMYMLLHVEQLKKQYGSLRDKCDEGWKGLSACPRQIGKS